ncbi:MAG: CapA family protein [Oscillospiraceae bacterium]|nr:CapA family protein [Oscillospiraceae bacterium]
MSEETRKNVTVGFTGDITFTKYFGNGVPPTVYLSQEARAFLSDTDHCVCNLEGPLTKREKTRDSDYLHSSAPELAEFLPELGLDIWNLANNHMLDFGAEGLQDTLNAAAALRCQTLGAGKTAEQAASPIVLAGGGGVGILGLTYSPEKPADGTSYCCLHWDDMERIRTAISSIKEKCRWCVLVIHGGDEFSSMPMAYTRSRYLRYLQLGADVIVGHHPHVPQNYERVGDKIIFYSLGNFIFDTDYQRAQDHTDTGILLKLIFHADGFLWDCLPVRIDRNAMCIKECERPAVFTEISEKEYQKLRPYASAALLRAERRRAAFLSPKKMQNYPKWKWVLRELRRCRNRRNRELNLASLRTVGRSHLDGRLEQIRRYF